MFKGFTVEELKEIFDSLNMYGLELLAPVIEAWQFEHEEDGEVLKEAFDSIYEEKERNQDNIERDSIADLEGLKRGLHLLSDKEFEFIGELLDLNPDDVFMHNPLEGYCDEVLDEDCFECYTEDEDFDEEPYVILKGIYSDIEEERMVKKVTNSNLKFCKRYTKSLNSPKKKDGFRPYSF